MVIAIALCLPPREAPSEAETQFCEPHLKLALLRQVSEQYPRPADLATIWPALVQLLGLVRNQLKKLSNLLTRS